MAGVKDIGDLSSASNADLSATAENPPPPVLHPAGQGIRKGKGTPRRRGRTWETSSPQ